MRSRKQLSRELALLAAPIIVQNLLSSAVNSMDVVMLNMVGQDAISAVSLASQIATLLFMFLYGAGTGATMLTAQYYGKKDLEAIRVVQGIAMRITFFVAAIFAVLAVVIPAQLMMVFTSDPVLIGLGVQYLRLVSIAYLCWGIVEVYLSVLRSIGKVNTSMVLNILAFVINILLNATFILGWFGCPKMGVAGVALATSLSRVIELIGCLVVSAKAEIKLDLRYMFRKNSVLFKDFVHMAFPAMMNDIVWGTAFAVYSVILGHLGTDAVAANSLGCVVRNFGSVMCFGMASAGGILLGQILGEAKYEEAKAAASVCLRLTLLTSIIGGILILAVSPFVVRYADFTDTARGYLRGMLMINSYYITGMAVNTTLICGVFRAGGDSKFGLRIDAIDMWCYAVPLGLMTGFVLKLPVMWVFFFMCTDEFVKWPWVIRHYLSGKWLNNVTRDDWQA